MNRLPAHRYAPDIARALHVTRRFARHMGTPDFLCGVDPVFAGLHDYIDTSDGRSYRDTAHCVHEMHQQHMPRARRRTTIVLPQPRHAVVIVHELGHALDEALGFPHIAQPVSDYARTNRWEAFAEAFTSWLFWGYADDPDPETAALFASLEA